ncbi:phage portal protein, partial [Enterococcus lactis]
IFTPNLPKAILEELKSLVDAGAELSQETILGLASFVPDVQAELKRVNAETSADRGVFDSDKETDTEVEEDEST